LDWNESLARSFRGPRGHGLVWQPAPDVVVTRLVGRADLAAVAFYQSVVDPLFDEGRTLAVFHDWSRMTAYDAEARDKLLRLASRNKARYEVVHYLLDSKLLSAVISIAALTLRRRLVTHTKADTFLSALDERLAGPR
jgi:hypothetical protein